MEAGTWSRQPTATASACWCGPSPTASSSTFASGAEKVDSIDDPLNYGDGYTSDGVVVIRHITDIGADAQGQPVEVTFYSVYMHLHSIRDNGTKGPAHLPQGPDRSGRAHLRRA